MDAVIRDPRTKAQIPPEGAAARDDQAMSPWGVVLRRVQVQPEVAYLNTNRHSGYHLAPAVNERIPESVRRADGYYEADVEGALCAYFVPFPYADQADVLVMLEAHYPHVYAGIVRGEFEALRENKP